MARSAASFTSSGPSKSGKPCPRLTAWCLAASAENSEKTVVPNPATRFASRVMGGGSYRSAGLVRGKRALVILQQEVQRACKQSGEAENGEHEGRLRESGEVSTSSVCKRRTASLPREGDERGGGRPLRSRVPIPGNSPK